VIQDHAAFRRKQWCYFILDEAHYIKNFKSQRWQMLLNFNSQRRLLLTGTPLQNDLMELWSLMHFLMPSLFDSLREFKDWFVNPLTGMIEGSHEYNQELVQRLHKVLRPFLLRRLKVDVEKQLPKKREIIKYCRLSKRQRYLYEEFMSLSDTKKTLASGNFLSVINVLMQLRKVCNHPNLFEPRPTVEPYRFSSLVYKVPGLMTTAFDYNPDVNVNLSNLQLIMQDVGARFTTIARDFIKSKKAPLSKLVEEIDEVDNCDVSSAATDLMVVDDATDALESDKVIEAYSSIKDKQRDERRLRLQFLADINDIRCDKLHSIYFSDLKDTIDLNDIDKMVRSQEINVFSNGNGRLFCESVERMKSNPRLKLDHLSHLLDAAVKSPEQLVEAMTSIIDRFIFCVPTVVARPISLHVTHQSSSRRVEDMLVQRQVYNELSPKMDFLNKIMAKTRMSFPELRLIEYDCGKLQELAQLLIELKSNDHRVLIFTQMSRMLDILEQFLNYHGHTYLRLDGATKIDQRQILMERFNNDKRIFCFILSTRSGGLGVNLVGADTVIFYDSDWNPTMDAQAQDRCHRIGQTRDVCIYRLISEDTIEQNIYRKAQQKRMLGDLAIEEGNFGNSCFKKNTIQELFERNREPLETSNEVDDRHEELSKAQIEKLEQALSKCEAAAGEVMDVDAIKVARADEDTDLREFDENIPLTEENSPAVEKSEKEQQIDQLVAQMKPVEQYAVKYLESIHHDNFRDELEQAEKEYSQELENKKSQWEQSRIDLIKEQAIVNEAREEDSKTLLTYPKGAKCEHVHYMLDGQRRVEEMPVSESCY
jgi:SNF2 family DNA or RNA helicase